MIGFLCNKGKESLYCLNLYSIINSITEFTDTFASVFTIDNIALKDKKVYGYIISNNHIDVGYFDIPNKIINLSIQPKKEAIYTLRRLIELDGVRVFNEVNRLNQWMIMEIIASSSLTREFLLPYLLYNKFNLNSFSKVNFSFLMIPQYGTSLSTIIYGENFNNDKKDIFVDTLPVLHRHEKSNWLILNIQKLLSGKTFIPVIRCYLQKSANGEWRILGKSIFINGKRSDEKIANIADSVPLMLINYISNFIPSIHLSHMDFIIGNNDIPYFLHLGGWDKRIIFDERNRNPRKEAFINFLRY